MLGEYSIEYLSINEEGGLDFQVSTTHQETDYASFGTTYPVTISSTDLEKLAHLLLTALSRKQERASDETKLPDPAPHQNPPAPSAQG